ncbi:MAG: hypothetical protein FWG51_01750 [Firmicutes bacterium]|nr:hypothetical protein [Bacillota bacterium]
MERGSYFDGNYLAIWGIDLLFILITLCTITIGLPYAMCFRHGWICKHTVMDGKRMRFIGKSEALLGRFCIWFCLTVVTAGVWIFFIPVKIKKWYAENTFFYDDEPSEIIGGSNND